MTAVVSATAAAAIRQRARNLHPGAWWGWASALALAASQLRHPILLVLTLAVVGAVVMARRTDAPWGHAFALFLKIGVAVLAIRTVAQILFGVSTHGSVLFELPAVTLPTWAAGVALGGPVTDAALVTALTEGLRLAVILACVGAANALANPKRLLASVPAALYELGVALVIALTFTPSLASSVQRVRAARRLRGRDDHGWRSWRDVAVPVIDDALQRSLALAAAMDARGYGRTAARAPRERHRDALLLTTGLVGMTAGVVVLLNGHLDTAWTWSVLMGGVVTGIVGVKAAGRRVPRTRYRPDPWRWAETATFASGLIALAGVVTTVIVSPNMLSPDPTPLGSWVLPPIATVTLLCGVVPAWLTPPPPETAGQPRRATTTGLTTP